MVKYNLVVWVPFYADISVEASSYDAAVDLAKKAAQRLPARTWERGEGEEIEVMPGVELIHFETNTGHAAALCGAQTKGRLLFIHAPEKVTCPECRCALEDAVTLLHDLVNNPRSP